MRNWGINLLNKIKYVLPAAGALCLTATLLSSPQILTAKEMNTVKGMPLYNLDANDPNLSETLKTSVINNLAQENTAVNLDHVDLGHSEVSVSHLDLTKRGIQAVTIKTALTDLNDKTAVNNIITESAVINLYQSAAPVLKLKKNSIVVNNGDDWNPCSYIASIADDSRILPVLKEVDNVDMSTDGDYYASYTVIDEQGNNASTILNVTVKTPQEVLDARAAAAAAEAAAEEARREEEERQRNAAIARARAAATPLDMSKLGNYAGGIATALSMCGTVRYQWGGTTPETGFDCSGFVAYCLGISARTASQQAALGTHRYDINNAPAGAIYFYGSESDPHHVAISLGNGSSVQAMNPVDGIATLSNAIIPPDFYVVIGQ